MKEEGSHEGCIEQIERLFSKILHTGSPIPVDKAGRIRIDGWELNPQVQAKITDFWQIATTESLSEIGDLLGYSNDFHNLFGSGFAGINYTKVGNEMLIVASI